MYLGYEKPSFGPRTRGKGFAEGKISAPTLSSNLQRTHRTRGKTACSDDSPLYISQTALLKILMGGIVHQSNYVAINGDQPCAGRHNIFDGAEIRLVQFACTNFYCQSMPQLLRSERSFRTNDPEKRLFSQFTDALSLVFDPIDCIIVRLVLPPFPYCRVLY